MITAANNRNDVTMVEFNRVMRKELQPRYYSTFELGRYRWEPVRYSAEPKRVVRRRDSSLPTRVCVSLVITKVCKVSTITIDLLLLLLSFAFASQGMIWIRSVRICAIANLSLLRCDLESRSYEPESCDLLPMTTFGILNIGTCHTMRSDSLFELHSDGRHALNLGDAKREISYITIKIGQIRLCRAICTIAKSVGD